MVNLLFIVIFALIFGALTWRRFEWGLFLLFLLLPAYLLRFYIGPIPSTILELMILIICGTWVLKEKKYRTLFSRIKYFYENYKLLFLGILLFLVGATISIFTSINIRAAAGEWRAFYIEPILIFFTLVFYFQHIEKNKRQESIEKYSQKLFWP